MTSRFYRRLGMGLAFLASSLSIVGCGKSGDVGTKTTHGGSTRPAGLRESPANVASSARLSVGGSPTVVRAPLLSSAAVLEKVSATAVVPAKTLAAHGALEGAPSSGVAGHQLASAGAGPLLAAASPASAQPGPLDVSLTREVRASPSPTVSPEHPVSSELPGAKRWDIPGGTFLLPDWTPVFTSIEKGMGVIAVSRSGQQPGGVSLCWNYQPEPLSPRELGAVAPAYLGLLKRIFQEDLGRGFSIEPANESEFDVVVGHAAVRVRVRLKGPVPKEGSLVIWDCSVTQRTFAFFCYAPSKSITSQMVYAISKYAACHAFPVDYDDARPLAFEPPSGWKTVVQAPNQLILSSPDEAAAIYLVTLAISEVNSITPQVTTTLLDTLGQLVGRLVQRGEPQVAPDALLGHDVGRIRAQLKVDQREASGLFEFWFCPMKRRVFARILLSKSAIEADRLRPIFDAVHCH